MSFITFQNYINSSIYNRYETLEKQHQKYRFDSLITETGRTDIELIIGIANYFKHRNDHQEIHKGTQSILVNFNLHFGKETNITNSGIIKDLEYFFREMGFN